MKEEFGLSVEYFDDVPYLLHVSLIICSTKSTDTSTAYMSSLVENMSTGLKMK